MTIQLSKQEKKLDLIPYNVFLALIEREHSIEEILLLTSKEMFEKYCEWHGLINWGKTLWDAVEELQKIKE